VVSGRLIELVRSDDPTDNSTGRTKTLSDKKPLPERPGLFYAQCAMAPEETFDEIFPGAAGDD
jgi:hypothetical protein